MSTLINMTTKRPDDDGGKTITKKISNVNPAADHAAIATFAGALNSLSKNELEKIERKNKRALDIPQF